MRRAKRAKLIVGLSVACLAGTARAGEGDPRVTHVAAVTPDVLAVTVEAGKGIHGRQVPYEKQPGDQTARSGGQYGSTLVKRNGKPLGALVGRKQNHCWTYDRFVGRLLDTKWADRADSYAIESREDGNYRPARQPSAVWRKSKPTDMLRVGPWKWAFPVAHVLYLKLPAPLKAGAGYTIRFRGGPLTDLRYAHRPSRTRSEAVHVSHVGFRPDDPVKVAFLSCWLGTGGGLAYRAGLAFRILDQATGKEAFAGKTALATPAGRSEDPYNRNYNGTDVYRMDFSALRRAGTYRVCVEGVGCSYPFEIADDIWRKAFRVSVRGFYHQRSGIELGPPHTTYRRPRCFHPGDGVKVYASTCPLMDSGNGLNALGTDKGNFANLVKGRTDRIVPDAWGGYFDAGDWDRRIQHLYCTRLLLELAELYPDFVARVSLNIPESGDDLPDTVNEALWNLDCYRRMQTPDGGIRGGIESAEHPRTGECSWQESLPVMAYAPGVWSSYVYAGDAARAAHWLRPRKPKLAAVYEAGARRAMQFAERVYPRRAGPKLPHAVRDARNLAAAELFRLTGEAKWHEVFLATTAFREPASELFKWQHHEQRDAAFVYAVTRRKGIDEQVQANARKATLREADTSAKTAASTGFGWTKHHAWEPVGWGKLAVPQAVGLLRAWRLSGEARYLRAAILACQSGLGANPSNTCYTTGLGHRWPQHPLMVDPLNSGQAPPAGITIYGPFDTRKYPGDWAVKLFAHVMWPPPGRWPTTEAYIDVAWLIQCSEFTVHQTLAPTAYVWGTLAARR